MGDGPQQRPDRGRGGTAVEGRATVGTASTGIGLGVLGTLAGLVSIVGIYHMLMGVAAAILGAIGLLIGFVAWRRANNQTGASAGTKGTNSSIAGAAFGALAVVLGIVGMVAVGGTTDVDEGVDQIEQDTEQLGDDVEELGDEVDELGDEG